MPGDFQSSGDLRGFLLKLQITIVRLLFYRNISFTEHPKVKLFITQSGLQSTDEAITAGVPLIGVPMLGDQWFNTELYVIHKIGIRVDMDTLTDIKFTDAIKTVIGDVR